MKVVTYGRVATPYLEFLLDELLMCVSHDETSDSGDYLGSMSVDLASASSGCSRPRHRTPRHIRDGLTAALGLMSGQVHQTLPGTYRSPERAAQADEDRTGGKACLLQDRAGSKDRSITREDSCDRKHENLYSGDTREAWEDAAGPKTYDHRHRMEMVEAQSPKYLNYISIAEDRVKAARRQRHSGAKRGYPCPVCSGR